jgi:hypothetical protein
MPRAETGGDGRRAGAGWQNLRAFFSGTATLTGASLFKLE